MEINKEWLAPCGLYCGVCAIMIAHRNDNQKFKERLCGIYGVTADEINCEGCLSDNPFKFCAMCHIKDCTREKGYEGCHQCDEFPCEHIETFPIEVGKKVILRAIPQWREMGTEAWVEAEHARYRCPECGYDLFRGAKRCRNCKTEVDMD
jgi:hypothetical protein